MPNPETRTSRPDGADRAKTEGGYEARNLATLMEISLAILLLFGERTEHAATMAYVRAVVRFL